MVAGKKIFENKTWLIDWANDKHTELRLIKKTLPMPNHGDTDYFIMYDGKLLGNHHQGWFPGYIKEKMIKHLKERK